MKDRKINDSFADALRGIRGALRTERNLTVHFCAAVLVMTAAVLLRIPFGQSALLLLTCASVIAAEMINTAIEETIDIVKPEHCEAAGRIKDMAAGAVLVCAVSSLIIGLLIFTPPLLKLIN